MSGKGTGTIGQQYAAWPYPAVPLLANVDSTHPWQLHCASLWDRCGSGPAPARPRVWIAGCGTFQPYVFGIADPKAEILATDVSEPSLDRARLRCRLHGVKNVAFAPCDLEDPSTWPDGRFHLIECYGVLMNLRDPLSTLTALGQRLEPGGVLRVMVYPHFSRTRIFQLQRLARLLGFHAGDRTHPRRFRAVCRSLPKNHPLRWAFTNYADSRNDAGIVDAFLHAGDRGFTGWQLGALAADAGLRPGCYVHRPWAQPDVAAQRLGLTDRAASTVLGYLDLWQQLRQNFVTAFVRDDRGPADPGPLRPHPTFASANGSLRHALRLLRLRLFGGRVPTRTGDGDLVLRAREARELASAAPASESTARLREEGLWLGGDPRDELPMRPHDVVPGEAEFLQSTRSLRLGRRAPNPLYAHLFAALEAHRTWPGLALPSLDDQLRRWLPWTESLGPDRLADRLVPYAAISRHPEAFADHFARGPLAVAAGWHEVRLRDDASQLARARAFVREHGAPNEVLDDATARELAATCFAHEDLFLTLLPA